MIPSLTIAAALLLAQAAAPPVVDPVATGAQRPGSVESFATGQELLDGCRDQMPIACVAYVAGISDTLVNLSVPGASRLICLRPGIELDAVIDVVVAHLQAHERERAGRASPLVIAALRAAYPCPAD